MAVIITPESDYGKELRKWEQHPTRLAIDEQGDMSPGNPYTFRPYPRALYRAIKHEGRITVFYYNAQLGENQVHPHCIINVHDDVQERQKRNEGWHSNPQEAYDAFERLEQERGNEAARIEAKARAMSDLAQRELAAANIQTHEHVTDVVPTGKTGSGRGSRAAEAKD